MEPAILAILLVLEMFPVYRLIPGIMGRLG